MWVVGICQRSGLKIEAVRSSEVLVFAYKSIRLDNPEDQHRHLEYCSEFVRNCNRLEAERLGTFYRKWRCLIYE
jgi:hypothetical protein